MSTLSAVPGTVGSACHDVRRMLSQNLNDELVFLDQPYSPGDSTLRLKAVTRRIGPGTTLSWQGATFYIVAASNTFEVEILSGYDGGEDISVPAGTPLRVNPRFSDYTLFRSLCSAINSMSNPINGLFGTAVEYFTGMQADDYYPIPPSLAGSVQRVLKVSERYDSGTDWARTSDFAVSLSPGNEHIRLYSGALQYEVVFAVGLREPTSFTDDLVADCGLRPSMLDIPALGAASLLMYGQEARRVQQRAQGDPRRAEDVPITGATGAARDIRRVFEQRMDEECARLISLFPYRM